jgi:hypothetical protein
MRFGYNIVMNFSTNAFSYNAHTNIKIIKFQNRKQITQCLCVGDYMFHE